MAVGTIWVGLNWRKDAAPFFLSLSCQAVDGSSTAAATAYRCIHAGVTESGVNQYIKGCHLPNVAVTADAGTKST